MAALDLPQNYLLDETDPDLLTLRAPNGKVVAHFTACAHPVEIQETARAHERSVYGAWDHYKQLRLERALSGGGRP